MQRDHSCKSYTCKPSSIDKELLFLAYMLNKGSINRDEARCVLSGMQECIRDDIVGTLIAAHSMKIVSDNSNVLWLADELYKEVRECQMQKH